jgi:hypothetical protein
MAINSLRRTGFVHTSYNGLGEAVARQIAVKLYAAHTFGVLLCNKMWFTITGLTL